MKIFCFFFLVLLLLLSCDNDSPPQYPPKIEKTTTENDSFLLKPETDNVVVCDSCLETVLIAEHDECTDCRDIYADSGTVYISRYIMRKLDSLKRDELKKHEQEIAAGKHLKRSPYLRLNTHDFYFETKSDFNKLWMNKEVPWFDAKYRIRGAIVLDAKNKQLLFRMRSYEKLDKKYAERFE